MVEKDIYTIYTDFVNALKGAETAMHPEFQKKLEKLSDLFGNAASQEGREGSAEFVDSKANSAETKQEMLEFFNQVYNEVESKKLLPSHKLIILEKELNKLEASIAKSESIESHAAEEQPSWEELIDETYGKGRGGRGE